MGTVVAIESDQGVAMAGDTRTVEEGTVTGRSLDRVFELPGAVVGAVGDPGNIQEFRRQLADEFETYRLERDETPTIGSLERIAARQAQESNVSAAIGAHDSEGVARLRELDVDGRVLESTTVALGSGAAVAVGQLDAITSTLSLEEAATHVTDILESVLDRDVESGGEIVVLSLENESLK